MNYAILAESAARDIARTNPEVSISEATSTIAAALRAAANVAAWRGYDYGFETAESVERCRSSDADRASAEMVAEFGPRPKENRDE